MSKKITLELSEETYEAIKSQLPADEAMDVSKMEDFVGNKMFIRTVTMYYTGKIEKIVGNFLHLSSASWIADTGTFSTALKDGVVNEVEPMGETFVNISTIVDMTIWKHKLPLEKK